MSALHLGDGRPGTAWPNSVSLNCGECLKAGGVPVQVGDSLAYSTPQGWAFSGHYFHAFERGQLVTRESFASGAVRFESHTLAGWAVIRGTEVVPLV